MEILFNQEYAVDAYGWDIEREVTEKVTLDVSQKTTIETYKEFGLSIAEAIKRIAEKFNISNEEAEKLVNSNW